MSDSLDQYLDTVPVDERPMRREWGQLDGPQFQARVGPEVERLAALLEGNGIEPGLIEIVHDINGHMANSRPWYDLRLSEATKMLFAASIAFLTRGGIPGG